MLNVQKYIKEHGWESISTQLNIKVTTYTEKGLAVLNYSPKSPKAHAVVLECRALILSYPDAQVVARSFDRFFNQNEEGVDDGLFDFYDSWCMCKYDGSLILFYYCPQTNQWEIATRGRAFAEGPFGASNSEETFRLKILQASFTSKQKQMKGERNISGRLEEVYQTFAEKCLKRDESVILEYIGPENEIVTRYRMSQMVLLSIRNTKTGLEIHPSKLDSFVKTFRENGLNVIAPKMFRVKAEIDVHNEMKRLADKKEEGFVICQPKTMKRLKIKTPVYVFFHQIVADLEDRTVLPAEKIVKVVLSGRYQEFIKEYPMYIEQCDPYASYWEDLKKKVMAQWRLLQDLHHIDWHRRVFKYNRSNNSNIHTWIYYEALKTKRDPIYVLLHAKTKAQMKFFPPECVSKLYERLYWAYNY